MTPGSLWAPWRAGYLSRIRRGRAGGCLFCRLHRDRPESRRQILTRGRTGFSLLNRFPYSNGHLLIAPYRHVGRLELLTLTEWMELFRLVQDAICRLEAVLKPQGYNVGFNLGRAAGAGVPRHLHLHVVPRWTGDTNFMPVVSGVKVVSQSLEAAHRLLKGAPVAPSGMWGMSDRTGARIRKADAQRKRKL